MRVITIRNTYVRNLLTRLPLHYLTPNYIHIYYTYVASAKPNYSSFLLSTLSEPIFWERPIYDLSIVLPNLFTQRRISLIPFVLLLLFHSLNSFTLLFTSLYFICFWAAIDIHFILSSFSLIIMWLDDDYDYNTTMLRYENKLCKYISFS